MFPEEAVKQLKSFTDAVKNNPNLLHTPQLLFFKHFIESFGGKVPTYEEHSIPKTKVEPEESSSSSKVEEEIGEGEEIVESDVELDNTGVIGNNIVFIDYTERNLLSMHYDSLLILFHSI